ncbi:MAG: SAM-dependent methyltransferase, partial [Stellaceae bacterium]
DAPVGAIRERSPDGEILAAWLGNRVATQGGAALLVDYGYADESAGDTVQALKAHRRHDPLADPGEADVTAHVDFAALARAAGNTGARIFGPIAQGMFLHRLGVATRAAKLMDSSPAQATTVAAALRRLTDPDAMGALFKVMAIANSALPPLAGFA